MRTIILFNDSSSEAINAGRAALAIACKTRADLLVLNLCKISAEKELAGAEASVGKADSFGMEPFLVAQIAGNDFKPVVNEIDASSYTEKDISELVISKNIWLMIKGIETHITHEILCDINIQAILNHVACPLLLVPDSYAETGFKNITYALDMRYCRRAVVKFLAELARVFDANLVIEHISAKGLPHLGNEYAMDLFTSEISNRIIYDKVYFNNIKERDLGVAVDVIVSDLHADLLALVNHRFHFEELFGRSIKNVLPEHVPVPVIIFPH